MRELLSDLQNIFGKLIVTLAERGNVTGTH